MTLSDLISQRVDKNKDLLIRNITVEPRFVRISRLVNEQPYHGYLVGKNQADSAY